MMSLLRDRVRGCARYVAGWSWVALLVVPTAAPAEDSVSIVRVEEDWELVVATPDPNSTAPQVTCAISPTPDVSSIHSTFELNHQSQPSFTAGGMQLQIWDNELPVSSHRFPHLGEMSTVDETVHWIQVMSIESGNLEFEVIGGTSTTWDSFGGQGYLKASLATDLVNLNGYDPAVTVANSGIGYAANRVQKLVLKEVRITLADGRQFVDSTTRSIYPKN